MTERDVQDYLTWHIDDFAARLLFGEMLAEAGHGLAPGYTYMGQQAKCPHDRSEKEAIFIGDSSWSAAWAWWSEEYELAEADIEHRLPGPVFAALRGRLTTVVFVVAA